MLTAPYTNREEKPFHSIGIPVGEQVLTPEGKEPTYVMTVGTHYFKLTHIVPRVRYIVEGFATRVTTKTFFRKQNKWQRGPDRCYYSKTHDSHEYRFPISLLKEFRDYMEINAVSTRDVIETTREIPIGAKKEFKLNPAYVLREEQRPVLDYVLEHKEIRSKMIGLQTGKGKTVIACAALAELKGRVVLVTKPMYIDKWVRDFQKYTDLKPKDLMVVQGSDHFRGLIQLAKDDQLSSKVIIISINTYRSYLKLYEEDRYGYEFKSYGCDPEDFFPLLETGSILIDEVHQEFFAYYKMLLFTQCSLVIALSATLENLDQFMERMYHVAFPRQNRFATGEYDCYIKMFNISYQFWNPEKIRVTEFGSPTYSHSAFEKSIMRHPPTLKHWLTMIDWVIERGFVANYKPGDKLAIFASTKEMCRILRDHIRQSFPQYRTEKYVDEDPYENIIEPDIRCTTILSGGTAIDIPGLTCSILTINILSIQANAQTLGRLRKIEGRDVRYYVMYCDQIPKHREYYATRNKMLRERVASISDIPYCYAKI